MDENTTAAAPPVAVDPALEAYLKSLTDKIDRFTEVLASIPEAKDIGIVSNDVSGSEDAHIKSFGDMMVAIRVGNHDRLKTVYKAALNEADGPTGGWTVPEEYGSIILAKANKQNVLRLAGARVEQLTRNEKSWPMLDIETAPAAGNTSFAGGVIAYWTEEAAQLSESEPKFRKVRAVLHKLAGYAIASDEVEDDASLSIDSLLADNFAEAIAAQEEYQMLRGNGVGKPKGITESGAFNAVARSAASAVALADLANMVANFMPQSFQRGVWFLNPRVLSKLVAIQDDPISWQPDLRQGMPAALLGMPYYITGALPELNTAGDIMLVDPSYYLIAEKGGLEIAYSPHFLFRNHQNAWRASRRVDGKPLVESTITLSNGTTTVSPFVGLAAG